MITSILGHFAGKEHRLTIPYDLTDLIRIDHDAECDPRDAGMTQEGVDAIWNKVLDHYRTGYQPAISICLRRRGKVVMKRSVGHAAGADPSDPVDGPKQVMDPATPVCVFSASKAVTGMLIHLLDERGSLHIDDRVVEYIPEFGKYGKDTITLRHVLTHRAGIPFAKQKGRETDILADWNAVVSLLCESAPRSRHGRRLSYHAITGGFILGEVIQRVTGKSIATVLDEEFRSKLGMEYFTYGMRPEQLPLLARSSMMGEPPKPPFDLILKRALGIEFDKIAELANDPVFLTSVVPSGNMVATAEEMSRFYQMLLDGGRAGEHEIFESRTVRRARNESAYLELDHTLLLPVRYGLGFMLGGDLASLYGPDSGEAFGHLGFSNMMTWADPSREISVGYLTTGKTFVPLELWAQREALAAISEHCHRLR